jgi:hypothetical protein
MVGWQSENAQAQVISGTAKRLSAWPCLTLRTVERASAARILREAPALHQAGAFVWRVEALVQMTNTVRVQLPAALAALGLTAWLSDERRSAHSGQVVVRHTVNGWLTVLKRFDVQKLSAEQLADVTIWGELFTEDLARGI